ncbi:hypothetical protein PoB_000555300 [Plakobranchus ocellatus]|uniref:Uncharacterized protein n=1 Tax=Plakobranchus ocellatus TaxID=259542 RepID=A0AAV3Y9D7_9GAST|nr:hypothetical protein PoB_000555300 [Plakobranchus ocellatus]
MVWMYAYLGLRSDQQRNFCNDTVLRCLCKFVHILTHPETYVSRNPDKGDVNTGWKYSDQTVQAPDIFSFTIFALNNLLDGQAITIAVESEIFVLTRRSFHLCERKSSSIKFSAKNKRPIPQASCHRAMRTVCKTGCSCTPFPPV